MEAPCFRSLRPGYLGDFPADGCASWPCLGSAAFFFGNRVFGGLMIRYQVVQTWGYDGFHHWPDLENPLGRGTPLWALWGPFCDSRNSPEVHPIIRRVAESLEEKMPTVLERHHLTRHVTSRDGLSTLSKFQSLPMILVASCSTSLPLDFDSWQVHEFEVVAVQILLLWVTALMT